MHVHVILITTTKATFIGMKNTVGIPIKELATANMLFPSQPVERLIQNENLHGGGIKRADFIAGVMHIKEQAVIHDMVLCQKLNGSGRCRRNSKRTSHAQNKTHTLSLTQQYPHTHAGTHTHTHTLTYLTIERYALTKHFTFCRAQQQPPFKIQIFQYLTRKSIKANVCVCVCVCVCV